MPTELLSTVLGRWPAKNGGPENPSRDSETKEKDYQGSQAQYMARLTKAGSEMYVDMTKVATAKIYSLLDKGVGGDDPAKVHIPQDPACALEVMMSLHCPTAGYRNTDNIGGGLLVEAGKTSRAEITQSQVADMREKFQKESLAESRHKANMLVDTMYVACHGVPHRLPRAIVNSTRRLLTGSRSSPV